MTESEKVLLRIAAESLAFVNDLRQLAISRGDVVYIRKTQGVEEKIAKMRASYPRTFQRYFKAAIRRAQKAQVVKDGQREPTENRQEKKAEVDPKKNRKEKDN